MNEYGLLRDIDKIELNTKRLRMQVLDMSWANEVRDYMARNREHFRNSGPLMDDAFFTTEYQRIRLMHELQNARAGISIRFSLFEKEKSSRTIIGDVHLSNIVRGVSHSCFLGYKMDAEYINQGYMTEAIQAAIDWAFSDLGLHRIEASIMPRNLASQRVVEKLGFVWEGLSRRCIKINGIWEDHYRFARLNE